MGGCGCARVARAGSLGIPLFTFAQEGDPSWPPRHNDVFIPKTSVASAVSARSHAIPDLTADPDPELRRFLQAEIRLQKRARPGLEGVLREIFPIESYDKTLQLEYISYDLGKPRYEPDECRQLRLTYGRPFRVWLRLNKEQPIEEEVYLGDMPIMIGGGEFIINGAERVVVSQLHRSPGVDFVVEIEGGRHAAARLPHHPRARQLDRDQRHQEGHARRPHRPERQVLGDDAAAGDGPASTADDADPPRVLRDRER